MATTIPTADLIGGTTPTDAEVQSAYFGSRAVIWRRVDVFNADGSLWMGDAPVVEGSVSIDYSRDERRTCDLSFENGDGTFTSDPNGFWYDKVLKIYRGVLINGVIHAYQLGEFFIDRIDEDHFPHVVKVTARDGTKKMMLAKFSQATAYAAGVPLESVIQGLAVAAGVARWSLPTTGVVLGQQFMYEIGATRWEAAKALAEAHNYELFFDRLGVLTMRTFVDPTTAPIVVTFSTGAAGNLASYSKSTNDSQIFNHVVVKGATTKTFPVVFSVENTEPSSPTRIARLGRRTYNYESKIIDTLAKATDLANTFLRVMALESYELSWGALTMPWLEVGQAIEFLDPRASAYAPTRFLLTSCTIPLKVGEVMSASAKRVTIIK